MRCLVLLLYVLSTVISKTYFTYDELVSWPRPTSLTLAPHSNRGLYFTTKYSLEAKNVTTEAFVIDLASSNDQHSPKTFNITHLFSKLSNQLTEPLTSVWLDATTLAFLHTEKLWALTIPEDLNTGFEKLNPISLISNLEGLDQVSDLKYDFSTQSLLFSAKATVKKNDNNDFGDSGKLYDQLFVRHWDTWLQTGSRRQLFYVKLINDNKAVYNKSKWVFDKDPKNLLANTELESPIAPFGDTSDFSISSDGKEVAFVAKYPDRTQAWSTKTDVYVVPIDGDKPQSLTPNNQGACSTPTYSTDGRYLAWLQMTTPQYEADKNRIVVLDLKTKSKTEVVPWWDRSPTSLVWSKNSDKLIVTADEFGATKLFYIVLKTNRVRRVTKSNSVSEVQHLKDDVYLFTKSSFNSPPEFYTIEIDNHFKLIRQSDINYETSQNYYLNNYEDFYFNGAESHNIHGMLIKPANFKPWYKYPLAMLIHGGPQGAWNDGWSYRWNPNVFANEGYVVVMINPHGSTGYGQNFTDQVNLEWGGKPYLDLMAGLDYVLEEFEFIDKQRVAALGGSYGGYMVNWINGNTNRFRVLVNHDGVFDTVNSYYTTDELYSTEYDFQGTPYTNFNSYKKWSPTNHLWKWSTPTLVIHSRKDYRLVEGEGLATFTALQVLGIKSRFLYFEDENHWVLKHANSRRWYKEVLEFINLYCRPYFYQVDSKLNEDLQCINDVKCLESTIGFDKLYQVDLNQPKVILESNSRH